MAVLKENETLFNIVKKAMPFIIRKEKENINKKWIFELKEKNNKETHEKFWTLAKEIDELINNYLK